MTGMCQLHRQLAIVIPVFNDWASLPYLLRSIDSLSDIGSTKISIIVVDDCSSDYGTPFLDYLEPTKIQSICLIRLACNLGHQRAIAVGLSYASKLDRIDGVVVMDSDGEDRAEDIVTLLSESTKAPNAIVCAQRTKRSESVKFKIFYTVYKTSFRLLTGTNIDFGNFCYIPRSALFSLVLNPGAWNHLAAAISRSRIPLRRAPTKRGSRFFGSSKMNFVSLVLHGLSAISVYGDVVIARLIITLAALLFLSAIGIFIVFLLRFATEMTIPGWASNTAGTFAIIFLQSFFLSIVSIFLLLHARSSKSIIPQEDALKYISNVENISTYKAESLNA